MHEMDLIPESYRRVQKAKRMLIGFGALYVLLITLIIAGKVVLNMNTTKVNNQMTILQEEKKTITEQDIEISRLKSERTVVLKQLEFVELLQKGGAAGKTFQVFDRVLNNTVWMDEWSYQAVALEEQDSEQKNLLDIKVKGKAIDHAALSAFVERLLAEPEINDVVVIKSAMLAKGESIVSFDMEIM